MALRDAEAGEQEDRARGDRDADGVREDQEEHAAEPEVADDVGGEGDQRVGDGGDDRDHALPSVAVPRMLAYAPPDQAGDLAVAPPLAPAGGDRRGAGRRCLLPRLPPAVRPGGPEALRRPLPDDAAVGDPGG